jgi:hypothetical protein
MRSEVISSVPFDAADVWSDGNRWSVFGEVDGCVALGGGGGVREWDDVQVVEKDPKDFFSYVGEFFAPEFVGTGGVDFGDEVKWFILVGRSGIAEVGEKGIGSCGKGGGSRVTSVGEVGEEERDDDAAGCEFGRPFVFIRKKEVEESGEEGWLDC